MSGYMCARQHEDAYASLGASLGLWPEIALRSHRDRARRKSMGGRIVIDGMAALRRPRYRITQTSRQDQSQGRLRWWAVAAVVLVARTVGRADCVACERARASTHHSRPVVEVGA